MANETIYPYGTNGQLPSSIGVINDLTTGGADKALSAEMGKEIGETVYGKQAVTGTWSTGGYQFNGSVGGTFSGSVTTVYPYNSLYKYCKLEVVNGDKIHVKAQHNGSYYTVVIVDSEGEVLQLSGKGAVDKDYNITADGFVYITNQTSNGTPSAVIYGTDGHAQFITALQEEVSQIGELAEDVGSLDNSINGRHIIGEWSARRWETPTSIAVGDVFSADSPSSVYGNDEQYDHCEKLQVEKGDTLVVKSKVSAYYQTVVITKTNGEVVVASGTGEINQSFSIEHNGYAYINKDKTYTGQKAEIHVYSVREYVDEKTANSQPMEKEGTKQEGKYICAGDVGDTVSLLDNSIYNVYIFDVVEDEIITIKASHAGSGAVMAYCFTDANGKILKKPSFAYTSAIQTFTDIVAPSGSAYLYVNEYYSANGSSSKAITTKLDGMALAPYRTIIRESGKFSDNEAQRYYELGAQKMDTYNLVQEKIGIISIGQSNIDNRIASADFPATANINGVDISLAKSIPTCKFIQGDTEGTYGEASKSFASYNNTGTWSFDQVVYNAVANALGSSTDFFVCKQSRGGTKLGYAYPTSFCADIDRFRFNSGYYSQLYHLKKLIIRALELQPDIKFKAIIMHQGEGDATNKISGVYYTDLCRTIQWIRGLVGSPKLPFIFGSIPTNSSSFSQRIYNDMARVAAELNDVYFVEIGEATDWVDDQWHSGTTGLHFGANTAVKLADDMYQLMVSRKMLAPYV